MAYGYGRLGDRENAQRLYDEIQAIAADQELGAGGWTLANLAVGDYDEALRWLNEAADKASRHEIDPGMFGLMNLTMNYMGDPMLEQAEFVEVFDRISGD